MNRKNLISVMLLCCTMVFAQNNNPYSYAYGKSATDSVKTQTDNLLYLHNADTTSEVRTLAFDFTKGKVYAYNAEDRIIDVLYMEQGDVAFISTDPHWFNDPGTSPYAYVGNNPIMRTDPTGMDYELTFQDEATKKLYTETMNKQLEGQFATTLTANKNGSYTLGFSATEGGGDASKMSEKGQAFYNQIKAGIDDHSITAKIGVVYGSGSVHVGNYYTSQIDIGDILQFSFNRGKGATQAGKIAHEFAEQFYKQKKGYTTTGFRPSHLVGGIQAENAVNGNNRRAAEEEKIVFKSSNIYFSPQVFQENDGTMISFGYLTNYHIIKIINNTQR